jgi:hypothetical protein
MRSRIRLDAGDEATLGLTSQQRPMVGQAPYVVNAGLTYADRDGRASATLLYNVVGARLYTAGINPVTDAYERPRSMLDLSVQLPLLAGLSTKLDARNLLDAPVEITQGEIIRSSHRTGRSFSLGLAWRP